MMHPTADWTDVLKEILKDPNAIRRLLEHPQSIGERYGSLPPEMRDLLIEFFQQVRAEIDSRIKGDLLARDKVYRVFQSSQHAFNDMRVMNRIIFGIGILLIGVSLWLAFTGQREAYVLLFGTGGIVTLLTHLFRPLRGVRDALSDFLQAHITFETVNQQIGAWHPTYFQPRDINEVQQVSDALQGIRESSVRLLQHALEEKGTKRDKRGG